MNKGIFVSKEASERNSMVSFECSAKTRLSNFSSVLCCVERSFNFINVEQIYLSPSFHLFLEHFFVLLNTWWSLDCLMSFYWLWIFRTPSITESLRWTSGVSLIFRLTRQNEIYNNFERNILHLVLLLFRRIIKNKTWEENQTEDPEIVNVPLFVAFLGPPKRIPFVPDIKMHRKFPVQISNE